MKITVLTSMIQNSIKKLNYVSDKEVEFPGILLIANDNKIVLQKSNGNTEIKSTIEADIINPGSVFIPINTIKLIEKLKNVDYIEINDEYIQADKKKITYKYLENSSYYKINSIVNTPAFEVSEGELNRLLSVKYAMSKEELRPVLTGINIQENRFAAVDGYRLSIRESKEFNTNINVTISGELVKILDKLINKKSNSIVKVFYEEKELATNKKEVIYLKFIIDNIEITSKLLEGEYIKYISIIPQDVYTSLTLDNTNILIENMEFLKNIKTDERIIAKFNIDNQTNTLLVSGSSIDNKIEDELNCNITGESLTIAFNSEYVLDVLKQYKEDNIKMEFISAVSPCIIRKADSIDNYSLDLILPVRLVNAA